MKQTDYPNVDVQIIGAGIIGLLTALKLHENGATVRILEAENVGAGASMGNLGMITPSHAPPLTNPDTLKRLPRSLWRKDFPLYVRPGASWQFLRWGYTFMRHCNASHLNHAIAACHALLMPSRQRYETLLAQHADTVRWQTNGLINLCWQENAKADFEQELRWLKPLGIAPRWLPEEELAALVPSVDTSRISGAWHHPQDAHLNPSRLLQLVKNWVEQAGIPILEQHRVARITPHAQGVKLQGNGFQAQGKQLLISAGVWSSDCLRGLGLNAPITAGKGYTLTADIDKTIANQPLLLHDAGLSITPWRDQVRIGGTMEFSGFNRRIPAKRIAFIQASANRVLKTPIDFSSAETWLGWRPMSADGIPLIGPLRHHPNIYVAAGHSMLGVSMAPATAQLVSDLISGNTPTIDPNPYNPERFS